MADRHLSPPDRTLLDEVARGRLERFDVFVDRYKRPLLGYLARRVGDVHRAEDLTQEVFLRAFRAARDGSLPDADDLAPWLFRVASNCAIDVLRARRRRLAAFAGDGHAALDELEAPGRSPLDAAVDREGAARVAALLGRLPREQAEAVALRVFAGLRLAQVAAATDATLPTVKSRLRLGLLKLHDLLERRGKELLS